MAACLRRALFARHLRMLLAAPCHCSGISRLSYIVAGEQRQGSALILEASSGLDRLGLDACIGSRRGFAKGRKSRDDDEGDEVQVIPDIGPTVKSTVNSQMESAIDALSRELSKLRTGRASSGMLDHIMVETSGAKMSLNHVAVVSVLDSKTLSVTPYDPDALKTLESAIVSSPLGLNPTADGQRLTKENVQVLCKVVAKSAEDVKQSIRRARQKALDLIKKAATSIPKDDAKRIEKEVEEITKRFVKIADDLCKAKEKEIAGR
ncbi:hypothetical protein Taro_042610 [Colocasia esculenta]|uniref:Ribosome-recycling factor, chloroplastic n=1 Tax=Colocasia esculenta TaxID=4460 RepID=A0A843WTB5_COLES|nr:hypothetical protein [Colocasia esculenta]